MVEETRGRKPSKALFFGMADDDSQALYDLEEFARVFVEVEDITEYQAAIKLVGSWTEWNRIKRDWPGFVDHIKAWIDEIEVKLRSQAIKKIHQLADSEDRQAFQAAKFLATKEYSRTAGSGRATKAMKLEEARAIARSAAETDKEEKRILSVLSGGKSS